MYFVILCKDKVNSQKLRSEIRPRHLDYLKSLGSQLKFAGPFVDEQGHATGSLIVVDAGNEMEALKIADGDPYAQAHLFAAREVKRWNWTVNHPEAS